MTVAVIMALTLVSTSLFRVLRRELADGQPPGPPVTAVHEDRPRDHVQGGGALRAVRHADGPTEESGEGGRPHSDHWWCFHQINVS